MTIFQMECFAALAKTLNFTIAAAQLYISQPALSRLISSVENELGFKLVLRNTRHVVLTPAGNIFGIESQRIVDQYYQSIQKAQVASNALVGNIRLGTPSDSLEKETVNLVRYLKKSDPGIHIDLRFHSPKGLIQALDDDRVDMIIASGRPNSETTQYLLLDRRPQFAALPLNHPLASRKQLSMTDLRNEKFILISRISSVVGNEAVQNYAAKAGYTANVVAEVDSVSSLLTLVACGEGVSVLYKEHKTISGNSVAFVPLMDLPKLNRYLLWKSDNNNSCINVVVQVAKDLLSVSI